MHFNASDSPYSLALPPGTVLADRFRIDGPVGGASAYAISYRAQDLTNGQTVVVKEFFPRSLVSRVEGGAVRPHSSEDDRDFTRALRRFALEGATLAEASHPNLVRVRRVLEANGTAYLVMDHHQTQSLYDFVTEAGGRLPVAQAGRVVQQLLSALEPLHAESIVHRDLSPRSLHVTAEGNALLVGFSARRHLAVHTTDLVPGFAAFEQYGTRDVGPWTDVYAASAILYYLLTGVTPPSALERAAGEALVPPSTTVPSLSAGLVRLVLRGMALLPQQRPHAASELRRQLEAALNDPTAAAGRSAPASLGFDATLLAEITGGSEEDRGSALRLAEGGIVVPGAQPSAANFLRKLGTAFRRAPSPSSEVPDESPDERAATTQPARDVAPPVEPAPAPRAATPVPAPAPEPMRSNDSPVRVLEKETVSLAAISPYLQASALPMEQPRRAIDIATEIALATEDAQIALAQPNRRRRYSLAAAAALVLGVGSSLVLLTRSGGAAGSAEPKGDTRKTGGAPAQAVARPVPPASHEVVESGALQQGKAPKTRADSIPGAAGSANHVVARPTAKEEAPPAAKPAPVLPGTPLPNVNVSVNAGTDLKMVSPELLVDVRTRLTNGQDLIEQGDYQMARRTFRVALTQLDSLRARYPDSQAIRALRRDVEQADTRAVQACGAENEMRARRGEAPRSCQ